MKNYGRQILRKWNIFRVFFFILSFCLCAGNLILTPQAANSATASTVRLSKTEGTVEISDSTGKAAIYLQNMRLANGDHTVTGERSYAWLSLDDTKVIKEDAVSNVEVRKRGQKMEVLVNSGSVFFNITEPLKADEDLNIRTSTMVMGVRGTCGVIKGVGDGVTCLELLTGHLECIVTNPLTGETKIIYLEAGDRAYFYADMPGQRGVTNIVIDRFKEEDLDGFALMELVGDRTLINKIREESGLDFSAYTFDNAGARLRKDQDETAAKNHQPLTINNRKRSNGIKDPVWEKDKDPQTDNSGSGDSGSGSSDDSGDSDGSPPRSRVVRLTMKVTAQEVQDYLDDPDVEQVILMPNEDTSQNTLDVDIDLNVPEGKTLTTQEGVYVDVNSGKSATVDGTAELGDTLTNNGLVTVNSSNTLKVNSDVRNYGSFVNTESGRTIVGGKFIGLGDSAFENRGEYEGLVSGEGMHLLNRGTMQGEVFGYFQTIELLGGTLNGMVEADIRELFDLDGGTVEGEVSLFGDSASYKLISGAITSSSGGAALRINAGDLRNVYLDGGTVTNDGSSLALEYSGSGTLNYTGGTVFRAAEDDRVAEPAIEGWQPVKNGSYYELVADQRKTITFVKEDVLSELNILVNGTAIADGKAKANPGDTVQITFENTASDKVLSIVYEGQDADGTLIPEIQEEGVIRSGENLSSASFYMPNTDITVDVRGSVFYTVTIDGSSTAFRDRDPDRYTLGGVNTLTGYFAEGDRVVINLTADAGETGSFNFEARNAEGNLFPSGTGNYSYSTVPVTGGAASTFSFDMPAGNVSVTGEAFNENTTIVHLEPTTDADADIIGVVNGMSMGTLIIRGGVETNSVNIADEMIIGSDTSLIISEDVTLELRSSIRVDGSLRNDGVMKVSQGGTLMVLNTLTNNGDITIETDGVFNLDPSDGTVTNASGATFTNYGTETYIGDEFQNDGTISNAEGAIMYVEPTGYLTSNGTFGNLGTLTNNGTFDNYGTFTNSGLFNGTGTFNNYSGHTFNNYGTVILDEGGVIRNGDGAGNDGVFNNFADGGVILNSGTIINNDGSTFRNYGTIIEETPNAVSPDLAAGSRPIVRYGEDPDAILSGIPEGTVGGQCGDTLFWHLEELEEEEAEELRHFTEGHTASASDAERAEDDASVSYVLHITGTGEMDDFTLEGGKSSAPWFEELDGAVRAVRIEEGLTQIGKNAFYGIRTLAYVSFAGTETEWQAMTARSGNEALKKTVLLFGGDDDLVLGDPLIAEDEEVSWTEPEAKPAAAPASADKPAAAKATASDAEKEETKEEQKEQGEPEQEVPEQEVPKQEDPKKEEPETPWNGKQKDEE